MAKCHFIYFDFYVLMFHSTDNFARPGFRSLRSRLAVHSFAVLWFKGVQARSLENMNYDDQC